jgi:hypothetical protein
MAPAGLGGLPGEGLALLGAESIGPRLAALQAATPPELDRERILVATLVRRRSA